MKKIQWWLKHLFRAIFKDQGNTLSHGIQRDFTDCGILCANTAAREIFENEILWKPKRKRLERVVWFNTLVKKHIDEVSATHCNAYM